MTTFVLLPGAGSDHHYWRDVIPPLTAAGHEALAIDLPWADESAGLADYADRVAAAIGGRDDVILVAQSLAAFVAPLVCERVPVTGLVLVCPMIPAAGESPATWWATTGQRAARRANEQREGRDPDAPFDLDTVFFHDVAPARVAEIMAHGAEEPSERVFEDELGEVRWPAVPTRVIAGSRDRLFPLEFMQRLARERLGVEAEIIDTSHVPAFSRPAELAALLAVSAS
jgi:pimeloyl-ACP methyl ester carboxylesterase